MKREFEHLANVLAAFPHASGINTSWMGYSYTHAEALHNQALSLRNQTPLHPELQSSTHTKETKIRVLLIDETIEISNKSSDFRVSYAKVLKLK